MPQYDYQCYQGHRFSLCRQVSQRDGYLCCPECSAVAKRVFAPSSNICVPAHFKIDADWCLPDREDAAGWEARQNSSQSHAPKQEDFAEYFERTVKSFD